MTLQLIDIAVRDKQVHPRLAGRRIGHVRAVLTEQLGGVDHTHDLAIPVWADVADGTSDTDIDMALMLKAASIVARLKVTLGTGPAA